MRRIKKYLLITFILVLCFITGCRNKKCKAHIDDNKDLICDKCKAELECSHNWNDATCDTPKTCSICNKTEGKKLDHSWIDATYITPKTCSRCNKTEGEPLNCTNHVDNNSDMVCDNCKSQLECNHSWVEATYTTPKTCSKCGQTEGEPIPHSHVDENEDNICDECSGIVNEKGYRPKWVANKQTGGFDGNGMIVKILVYPLHQYDPFNENYTKDDKISLQKQIRNIEKSYGIDLVFEEYPSIAIMQESRKNYIKENVHNGLFKEQETYIVSIDTTYISTLVKSDTLAELYNSNDKTGIFSEIGYIETEDGKYISGTYIQEELVNDLTSSFNKVYGYVNKKLRPDYYMYFNADLIKEADLTDPAELWLKGEWTWSKFEEYCATLKEYYKDKTVLEISYADFIIGSYASNGNKIATTKPQLTLASKAMIDRFKDVQNMKKDKIANASDIYSGSIEFTNGNTVFTNGYLYRVDNPNKFNDYDIEFTLGVVPYPTLDEQGGKPITTSNVDEAIKDTMDNPIKISDNEYIKGVDMSESSYLIPITTTECFSILKSEERKNNISDKVLYAIIYDLYESYSDNPEKSKMTEDEKYKEELLYKFNNQLYVETIMSVQSKTYFELISNVSLTVGGGTNWSYNGFWTLAGRICANPTLDAGASLNEALVEYKYAMQSFGYDV